MNKRYLWLLLLLLPLLFIMLSNKETTKVCFNDNCFEAEIADTLNKQRRGLMFRESLKDHEAMLFVYSKEGFYSFWMKNMNFPIDIIWINKDKEIVHLQENVPPCEEDTCPSYKPQKQAKYVLEIKAGLVKKLGITLGDKILFDL